MKKATMMVAMMDRLFLTFINMSLTGAFVILAIILARLLLKKAPKVISYSLWAVAGFRLLFPFSFESIFSLIPFNSAPIPTDIATQTVPRVDSGFIAIDNIVSNALPIAAAGYSANPMQIWTAIGTYVWLAGIAVMLIYGIVSYIALKHRMSNVRYSGSIASTGGVKGNIYEADEIKSPFVLGIIKPNIYLPLGLSGKERDYIILHERTHIRRRDHIIKFAAYFVLCLHWFNPFAWIAYILMAVDMELSCDERVLKEIDDDSMKKDYSLSLLMLSLNRPRLRSSPLAFSEDGLKTRIKNVLKYKKYSRITIIAAAALAIALGIGLALNAADDGEIDGAIDSETTYEVPNLIDREIDESQIAETRDEVPETPEVPEYIEINGETFSITETEINLDSHTVTDADLEQLRYLTRLQTLHITGSQWPVPDYTENGGIINLELISELTSLTRLLIICDIAIENISDISPLARLTNLQDLIIQGNLSSNSQISDLSPLENLPSLMSLHLDIPNVDDISPLARIPNLSHLGLSHPRISDFGVLTEMPKLMGLILNNPTISDFSFLSEMRSLRALQIRSDQMDNLSVLSELTFLQFLYLSLGNISDISPLKGLINLTDLHLGDSGISDISALSELTNLVSLGLSHNNISDTDALSELTNLKSLTLTSNPLSDINALTGLARLTSLVTLDLHYSQVSDISALAGLTDLRHLDLSHNNVSDLTPLAGLNKLNRLHLMFNPIEDVSALLGLTNLNYVSISYQQGFGSVRDLRAALPNATIDTGFW